MEDTTVILGVIVSALAVLGALIKVIRMVAKMRDQYTDMCKRAKDNDEGIKMLTKASLAILDGLKQQGCNGKVSEMHARLLDFVVDK